MQNVEVVAVLNSLIETCKDGEAGFRTCADDIKSPQLKLFFQNRAQSCASAAEDLQQLVRDLGGVPDKHGGLSGLLHRRWVDIKSLITNHDEAAVLEECERGEESAVTSYSQALQKELPVEVRGVVDRQYRGALHNYEQVRRLREQYEV
jgi:uncharacterized protein (TIGR02284 family)